MQPKTDSDVMRIYGKNYALKTNACQIAQAVINAEISCKCCKKGANILRCFDLKMPQM
jgi:hypothetical protein